ncbi:conditioned medium factor [Tieghemostelium lacteum]|uniref:Conditioned medium factor n=1 Tax=Tieghemostelium lacteum TaxID=361077 RepID=A0A152AA49_TIELA|nr:conditioned medium factor [Tieghemostelium lacteum]|eukprot:KYR03098.1 conditioned medium factor [Tieghemostelium lacteum]
MKILNLVLIFGIAFLVNLGNSVLVPKNLAGEPSEFPNFYLPNPQSVAQSSDASVLSVLLSQSQTTTNLEWSGTIPVDSEQEFTLSFFSNFNSLLNVEAFPPSSSYHHRKFIKQEAPVITNSTFGIDGNQLESLTYSWSKPTIGDWTVKVSVPTTNQTLTKSGLVILVQNPSSLKIYSYLQSYNNLFVGEDVTIVAMLYDDDETLYDDKQLPTPVKLNQPGMVQINLVSPDGQSSVIDMFDDGEHGDYEALDGIYGGVVSPNEIGNYQAQILFRGANSTLQADGVTVSLVNMVRSNQHIIPITTEYLTFNGQVTASQDSEDNVIIQFQVDVDVPINTTVPNVRLYSEVWGANNSPIAWVGGIATVQTEQGVSYLSATLNASWIALANATAPFTVKNVIISDLSTFVPLSNQTTYSKVKLLHKYRDVRVHRYPVGGIITKEMRDGKMPNHLADRYGKNPGGNGKLILVHGYCASNNPWPIQDFTNAVKFEDLNQNRGTDEFAQLVAAFAEQYTDGYSLIGHSQGGNQGLHLYTYYHSGLDLSLAYPGYILQSMGTPYQGTALAGTLASIGDVVGIGCSSNDDLTVDGAALWLNTIPMDKRSKVFYTTTQYKTGSLINYCSLPANIALKFPNDGVVDNDHAALYGGTYVNNIKGWCHTTDFKWPPQTTNTANNKQFDQNSVW